MAMSLGALGWCCTQPGETALGLDSGTHILLVQATSSVALWVKHFFLSYGWTAGFQDHPKDGRPQAEGQGFEQGSLIQDWVWRHSPGPAPCKGDMG